MKVYVFQAALLCLSCGENLRERLTSDGKAPASPDAEHTYDSDDFPKGPYGCGGGEADCPQHCDHCLLFLENPLTGDGRTYVQDALDSWPRRGKGAILMEWSEFYGMEAAKVTL